MEDFLVIARRADEQDVLAPLRAKFCSLGNEVYLDGNSLGKLPHQTVAAMQTLVKEEWGKQLIRGWNSRWYNLPGKISAMLAELLNARDDEVIIADNTSVNLFKLAWAALGVQAGRKQIISDTLNFPTDLYVVQGIISEMDDGHHLDLIGSDDGVHPKLDELESQLSDNTALLFLSLVTFKSGYMYDIRAINEMAKAKGVIVIWDLSHAAGAVPVDLTSSGTQMAVGCTYKYLNGGPGSPAFLFVNRELQSRLESPIKGWFGHRDPFAFELEYLPAPGINRFQVGSPPILSLAAIEEGLKIILDAGIRQLWIKSIRMSEFLISMFQANLEKLGYSLASPVDYHHRGSHVAIRHEEALRICQAMIHPKKDHRVVIPDFRAPDNICIGLCPAYNTFLDVYTCLERMREIIIDKEYESFEKDRRGIT